MKICFLGDAASIHIIRWCEYFRDRGHEVSIISFRNSNIKGVNVYCLSENLSVSSEGGNIGYLKKIFRIKKIIKKINPDIVNAHYLTSYGLIGTLINIRPLVVSTWGSDILVTPQINGIYKKITEVVIKRCDLITSDSKHMSDEIKKLGGKESKIVTVPMGINIEEFNSEDKNIDSKTFLSMRTLCDNSNIDIILKAFKSLLSVYPDSKLILTNSGDKEKEVLNLIEELNIKSSVEFKGFVNRDQVKELLKKCRTYISIPTSDSTSVNLLEGMASGIFPIVSNLPANKEWIVDGENGYILDELSETCLFKAMINSLEKDGLLESAIKRNKIIIEERALWNDNMDLVNNKYLEIIK